jgi:uncharacterized RDD family membrane protein YckC
MAGESGAGVRAARSLDGGILLRRWFGCWIDFVVAGVLFMAPGLSFMGAASISDGAAVSALGLALAVVIAYFTVTEGLFGRTLGKLVTGTIVVNAAGNPPGLWRALLRTLLRLVEANPFLLGGIPAGIVVALTPNKQRLGDLAAGTYVVLVKKLESIGRAPAVAGVFD